MVSSYSSIFLGWTPSVLTNASIFSTKSLKKEKEVFSVALSEDNLSLHSLNKV